MAYVKPEELFAASEETTSDDWPVPKRKVEAPIENEEDDAEAKLLKGFCGLTDREYSDYQARKNSPGQKITKATLALVCCFAGINFFLAGVNYLRTTGPIGWLFIVVGGFLLFCAFMFWDLPDHFIKKIEADKKMGKEPAPQDKIIYNLIYCVFIAGLIFTVAYVLIDPIFDLGIIILLVGIAYGMMKGEIKKFFQNTIGGKTEPSQSRIYQPNEKQKPPPA